nr:hypothetical protein [Tanacetum cinerariifolium]
MIIKYKIPCDLHPRLPLEEFMMSELLDDAIDAMVWRHPDAAIDDLRPVASSFNMADVRRLIAQVIKLRDMPEGVLFLSGLSRVWKNYFCDPMLRGVDENGNARKKKIKSLSKSLDNLYSEVARLFAALNQATILEAERDEEILQLKDTPPEFSSFFRGQFQGLVQKFLASDKFSRVQGKLLSLAASAGFNFPHVAQTDYAFLNKISKYAVEPLSVILQLEPEKLVPPANVSILRDTRVSPPIAKESNEEQVSAAVDGSDLEMTDGAAHSKSEGLTDVIMALFAGEKGDGFAYSSTIEKVVVPPSGGLGEGRVVCRRTLVAPSLGQSDCRCVVVHQADLESCHPP